MSDSNPLSAVEPWQLVADGYVEVTGPELAPFSADAIEHLRLSASDRVLDVACGPGTTTLQMAPRVARVTAVDFAANMLDHLRTKLEADGIDNVEVHCMDGQSLALEDASFDAAISMFGLMFFPDRAAGFAELHRTLVSGGRAAVSTWCPIDRSPVMQLFLAGLRAAVPELPEGDSISRLDNEDDLRAEMEAAGFAEVEVHELSHSWRHDEPGDSWRTMERGAAPIVLLRREMGERVWAERRQRAIEYLAANADFPCELPQTALVGVGVKR